MDHLIIFLLVTTMYFGINEACKKNHVVIHNELGPGIDLNIACRQLSIERTPSRFHTLKYKDPFYIIEFADNNQLPHGEKWYCLLSHGTRPKYWFDIEVYAQAYYPRCGQLRSWIARKDGIWFTRRYHSPPGHVLDWKIQ
ncbi:S-protein homolog 25 [Arabidopsis lyrata subsp. lyrata]|nr:S-protein homolog 25 [Arabidopsis lyrata subsp. lyrata]|eukprot:XP_002894304.2 S-protein homolog 25 [Arabidopsis lyrata subsp. lyrata]